MEATGPPTLTTKNFCLEKSDPVGDHENPTCPTAKKTRLKSKIAMEVTVDWKALLAMATSGPKKAQLSKKLTRMLTA